jgi:signal transduction histidine kinase
VFEWSVALPTLVLVGYAVPRGDDLAGALPWLAMALATSLMSVRMWGTVSVNMSLPVLVAAGMVLGAPLAGMVALLGSVDRRELRGQVAFSRVLFDHSQIALSAMAAAATYGALGGGPYRLPGVLAAFAAALAADLAVNLSMVLLGTRLTVRLPWQTIVESLFGERPLEQLLVYSCLGSVALVLVPLFEVGGVWGLAVGLAPLILAHQAFLRSRRLRDASAAVEAKNRALVDVSGRIAEERRDERLCIAGELHDEVIQPLYKVHLMGEVLRRDLATGRLLDLEEDLPELLEATQAAQDALRRVVRDLRDSSLGPGGLRRALEALIRSLEASCPAAIHTDLEEVGGPPLVQLLAYQIAREALQNAIKHARARVIRVSARTEEGVLRVVVEDDGVGFAPLLVRSDDHFGLQLMRERAEAAGGHLYVDSAPGTGTRVMASLPTTLEG